MISGIVEYGVFDVIAVVFAWPDKVFQREYKREQCDYGDHSDNYPVPPTLWPGTMGDTSGDFRLTLLTNWA
jgi:hypothetical protein